MENTSVSKYTISFGLSLALTSVINALLVVAKEKIPAVMTGLQKLTGHHWVRIALLSSSCLPSSAGYSPGPMGVGEYR